VTPTSLNNGGRTWSYDVSKYGPQQQTAPDIPNGAAGNGISSATGQQIITNNPNDAYVTSCATPASGCAVDQKSFVQHIVSALGGKTAATGGLKYYLLDNEVTIWSGTHADLFQTGPHAADILQRMEAYSAAVKQVDPGALVAGPEEWGWDGYIFSGFDQQQRLWGCGAGSDCLTQENGMNYVPWLLQSLRAHDLQIGNGYRSIDVLSLHYYPQGGNPDQNTRSLWDPNYTDPSWINTQIELLPRMKQWVNTYYPGLKTAVTEYNWDLSSDASIQDATVQADVLGIFGREGLDIATRWVVPGNNSLVYNAFKMYRNYNGQKSTFGDTSVNDTVPNPDQLSSFAATRSSDGALTIMVINKPSSGGAQTAAINIANFTSQGIAHVYQLTSANTITALADINVVGSTLNATVPASSITLFVLPQATPLSSPIPAPPMGLRVR